MDNDRGRWAAPLPRGWGDRLRALAMPVLLVAIAALGVYRTATLDQSSWQGASFGMFATYDNRSSRVVVVRVQEAAGPRRVAIPPPLHGDAVRLTVVPTDGGARRLAERIREELQVTDDTVTVEVVRVVVWDDDGLEVGTATLARGTAG